MKTREQLCHRIKEIIQPSIEALDLELIELKVHQRQNVKAVVVIVDRLEGGITIDECSHINRQLSENLEVDQLIQRDYTIEVSSPGLDRPLKTDQDFIRVKGRIVKFHLKETVENKLEHDGVVQSVEGQNVIINSKSKLLVIPLANIQKATQLILPR